MSARSDQPVAVFDSGVGGLTVLHELLVSLPTEDYLYLGDTGRFPYGERTHDELRAFSIEIAEHLLEAGAKLLVVACNAASSAALGALERTSTARGVEIDVIGVVAPATQLAVAGSRNRPDRAAGDAGDGRQRGLRARGPRRRPARAPGERGVPGPGADHPGRLPVRRAQSSRPCASTARRCARPSVDTVILGCTHYPLVAPMLQRMLGRGVTLVTSGAGVARSVERALASRELLNPRAGEGSYRFRAPATSSRSARSGRASCRCRWGRSCTSS